MRRLNYTGRRKIKKSDVLITLFPSDDRQDMEFEMVLDLGSVTQSGAIPGDSPIIVEAYKGPRNERFEMGTVSAPKGQLRQRLTSFGKDEGVLFRVKVVDAGAECTDSGRILAMASGVRPVGPTESPQTSLLPVVTDTIGDLVYKVDFDEQGTPVLILSKGLDSLLPEGIKAHARSSLFVSLVLPDVVRQILTRILLINGDTGEDEDEEDDSPPAKWKRLARTLNPEPIPSTEDGPAAMVEWIDDAVAASARRLDAGRRFHAAVTEQRS